MNTIDLKGDDQTFREIVSRTIDSFIDDALTSVGINAFQGCTALTTVDLPAATSIGSSAFNNCTALTTVNLPAATSIPSSAFTNCSRLTTVDTAAVTSIASLAFSGCTALTALILRNTNQVSTLSSTNVFNNANSAITYVPDALVDSYKDANNWSTYASRIKGLSELPT